MKYYAVDYETEAPLYWAEGDEVAHIMEFDTEEDVLAFIEAMKEVPYLDMPEFEVFVSQLSLPGSRNYTGVIPVANGDSVELIRSV